MNSLKPFHTIAIPHRDILEGRLGLDIFAADLWDVYKSRGPKEYNDAETFFRKTYSTQGLTNLLDVVGARLVKSGTSDSVIHIQTPFGGGKTHTLIALYHKAQEWKAKPVVIVGTSMSGQDTLWGEIEKQLTGGVNKLSGNISPGRETLREVIEKNQPVLILIDELLQYIIKAAGVKVLDSSLAAQTLAFIQELTELAGTLDKTCVVITLPSSTLEHYDTNAEKLYQQLQKIAGRVERIYSPVKESEITKVIRKRLFSSVDEKKALEIILEFVEYAEKEGILPSGIEATDYSDKFEQSFPFLPEVIETLYHKWGSFPTFQRTRGVLRLLSLVISSLSEQQISYISLADFDLEDNEIRRELIKHIGPEFDSVVSADLTNADSGARKVDKMLGKSYQGIKLGSRTATTVFMNSFSGGQEKGVVVGEIKRLATTPENPSSIIVEALDQLKEKLFFLQNRTDKFFFSNQPNLNRIMLTKLENIKDEELLELQKDLITLQVPSGGKKVKVFLWPSKSKDIPDSEELKMVIMSQKDENLIKQILESKGESPRVYKNAVIFLCPLESEKSTFLESVRKSKAYEQIQNDRTLNLSQEQKDEIEQDLKGENSKKHDLIRKLYRIVCVPASGNNIVKEIDLGIPDISLNKGIVQDAYDELRSGGEIVERISPLVIKERYLKGKDFIRIGQIFDSMMKTPGEVRYTDRDVINNSLKDGIKLGLFGLGVKEDRDNQEVPVCKFFKVDITGVDSDDLIVSDKICEQQFAKPPDLDIPIQGKEPDAKITPIESEPDSHAEVDLSFDIPHGKVSQIMGIMNLLQQKFSSIHLQIRAQNGSISNDDFENKIREALRQLGIEF